MDMFKKMIGLGSDPKPDPAAESEVNKSMYVTPSKDKKLAASPPRSKEDPGPLKGKMTTYKRTIVKTVTENKKRLDSKLDLTKAEDTLARREMTEKGLAAFFELKPEELIADLGKTEHCEILKEAILYLHKNGASIVKLENQEQGLNFPSSPAAKDQSE